MSESPQEKTEAQPDEGHDPASDPEAAASEPVASRPRATWWRYVLMLVLLGAAGAFGWYWYENRGKTSVMQDALRQQAAQADARAEKERRAAEEARQTISALQDKVAALESQFEQSHAQQAALNTAVQGLSRNRDDWTIAEVEQTLLIAAKQLQLSGDVPAALAALQSAQDKLRPLARPGVEGLRTAVGADIARLKKVPTLDAAVIGRQLNDLIAQVDKLPLAMDIRPKADARAEGSAPEQALWKRLMRETWEELKQLVRVERIDRSDVPLLAPSQVFFLRENLKLRLLNARLDLLTRDLKGYKADISDARDWLQRYYDVRDEAVARAVSTLTSLQTAEVSAEVPDISASLEAMRELKRAPVTGAQKP